jgi:hypothetical protein
MGGGGGGGGTLFVCLLAYFLCLVFVHSAPLTDARLVALFLCTPIRSQVTYFAMPLSFAGLAVAFKLASPWLNDFVFAKYGSSFVATYNVDQDIWRTFATIAAVVYMAMIVLYAARLALYTNKCSKEWHCPLRSPAFGMITITCTLFGFLAYDQFDSTHFGRALFWMGAATHTLLTVAKFGEWVGKR